MVCSFDDPAVMPTPSRPASAGRAVSSAYRTSWPEVIITANLIAAASFVLLVHPANLQLRAFSDDRSLDRHSNRLCFICDKKQEAAAAKSQREEDEGEEQQVSADARDVGVGIDWPRQSCFRKYGCKVMTINSYDYG